MEQSRRGKTEWKLEEAETPERLYLARYASTPRDISTAREPAREPPLVVGICSSLLYVRPPYVKGVWYKYSIGTLSPRADTFRYPM